MDQYVSKTNGRLPNTRGKESEHEVYNGGTIFVDAATSFTKAFHQTSLRAGDTLRSKHAFGRIACEHGITIKKYHGNNGIFQSSDWIRDCELEEHGYDVSGVGAQRQNGVAERAINTNTHWLRCMILHSALYHPS